MARDAGLEEMIRDELRGVHDISEKAMFGGWAWLLRGNLLCGARHDGMLVRRKRPGITRIQGAALQRG